MKKLLPILAGALVVQLGLCAFLITRTEPTATFKAEEPLLSLDFDTVDQIQLSDADGTQLNVHKKDGVWVLPEHFSFPVSATRIDEMFKAMRGFKKSWPVGKTEIAAKQFKVSADKFERQVSFFAGDKKLQTLYLGSSPSFRKVHARVNEEPLTYSIAYNTFDVPVDVKSWQDKNYLGFDKAQVKELAIAHVKLEQKNGDFVLTSLAENTETETSKTRSLVAKLAGLDFDEVLNYKGEVSLGEKVHAFSVTTQDGKVRTYTYFRTPKAKTDLAQASTGKDQKAKAKKSDKKKAGKTANASDKQHDATPVDEDLILVVDELPYAFRVKEKKVHELFKVDSKELVKVKAEDSNDKQAHADQPAQTSSRETSARTSSALPVHVAGKRGK